MKRNIKTKNIRSLHNGINIFKMILQCRALLIGNEDVTCLQVSIVF
jgi:hypothetical protein